MTVPLPDSLLMLVEAWRDEGAGREEIIERLDEVELLAEEERTTLLELVPVDSR